jgi:hypothetical protein
MQQPRFPSPSRKSRENGNAAVVDSPGISKPTPTNSPVAGAGYVTAREAAILATLAPEDYTTPWFDAEGAIGVGLLEIHIITTS